MPAMVLSRFPLYGIKPVARWFEVYGTAIILYIIYYYFVRARLRTYMNTART